MPFGPTYNEPANPRAAPVRACITAAATAITFQRFRTFNINVKSHDTI